MAGAEGSSRGQGGPGPYGRVALRTFPLKPPETLYDPASAARRDYGSAMYYHVLLNGKPKEVDNSPKKYFDLQKGTYNVVKLQRCTMTATV